MPEYYGREGLVTVEQSAPPGKGETTRPSVGRALSEGLAKTTSAFPSSASSTPPEGGVLEHRSMNNLQGESVILLLDCIKSLVEITNERLAKIHGILVAINRGSPKKVVGAPSAEEVD
mgnify:CR=1 FL=1